MIIEIVECESGRVARKWLSVSQICKYQSTTCLLPNPAKMYFMRFGFFEGLQQRQRRQQ